MGSSVEQDIRQTFDYAEIPGLAWGNAAVTSRVKHPYTAISLRRIAR